VILSSTWTQKLVGFGRKKQRKNDFGAGSRCHHQIVFIHVQSTLLTRGYSTVPVHTVQYCTCTVLYCTVSHASATTKKGKVKVRRGTEVGSSSHERESSVHDHTPAIMTHHHRSSYYYHRASITLPHATSASMEHKFNVITDILIKQN
jgi:hypothetical protein